jgi:hypothetical protein
MNPFSRSLSLSSNDSDDPIKSFEFPNWEGLRFLALRCVEDKGDKVLSQNGMNFLLLPK